MKHMLFDADGNFQELNFEIMGSEVNDAGTEVSDEVPANTPLLGQMTPNTGEVEGGLVTAHPGFKVAGSGGILDDPNFVTADFTVDGYVMMSVKVVMDEMTADAPTMAPSGSSQVFAGSTLTLLSSVMAVGFAL
jgi:hypothetical protein